MQLLTAALSKLRHPSPTRRNVAYRADIDGLRGVAVLAVIAFHLGVPSLAGGFAGVDVFFVISGYLITGILMKELEQGTFSYRSFYERRARRILPALFATLLGSSLLGAFLLIPSGFEALGKSVIATLLSLSNFYFWSESSYFGVAAAQMPLLHTWSLAIEEQFYLLLPPYLLLMKRAFGARWLWFLGPVVGISLVACVAATARAPSAAFYLPVTRAWELALGGVVATLARQKLKAPWSDSQAVPSSHVGPIAAELAALSGVSMIGLAFHIFDERTKFPGAAALLPSLGASVLIFAHGQRRTLVGALLENRVLVTVGLWSYSLYLWHWPLLVFYRAALNEPPTSSQLWGLSALIAAFGYLSFRFVETPFRHPRPGQRKLPLLYGGVAIAALLGLGGALAWSTSGAPERFPPDLRHVALSALDSNPHRAACDKPSLKRLEQGQVCRLGAANGDTSMALVGDSFADALSPALESAAREAGKRVAIYTRSGCHPLLVDDDEAQRTGSCRAFSEATLQSIAGEPQLRTVIFFVSWPTLVTGWRYGVNLQKLDFLTDRLTTRPGGGDALRALERGLERTVAQLEDKTVVLVAHWPEQKIYVPQTLTTRAMLKLSAPRGLRRSDLEARESQLRQLFTRLAERHGIVVVDLSREVCDDERCGLLRSGESLYVDYNHMSRTAALQLAPVFRGFFQGTHLEARLQPQIEAEPSLLLREPR